MDLGTLEQHLTAVAIAAAPDRAVGVAIDGKALRGVGAHGRAEHLVGLVRYDGWILTQVAIAAKSNELTTARRLLAGRDLTGTVITADAELTHRALARQIRQQGSHDLIVVKENQPGLLAAIATEPPWLVQERSREYR